MCGSDAVGEAVRAARVRADVAADRACLLRRGIGRVVEPEVADRTREVEVQHARLHPCNARLRIDLEHSVHLGRHDHHRVVERGRSPREPGPAPTRDEGPAVPSRDPNGRSNLLARTREANSFGSTDCDARVSRVQRELEGLGTRTIRTDSGSEIGDELVV